MKTTSLAVLASLCILLAASAALADNATTTTKPARNYGSIIDLHYIYFILSHPQELSLTDEQLTKFKDLRVQFEKEIDAMVDDPEYQALQKKMQEARKAKNDEEVKNVLQQIKDFRAKKAPTANDASKHITTTLTKEQNTKLSELLHAQQKKNNAETKPAPATQPHAAN